MTELRRRLDAAYATYDRSIAGMNIDFAEQDRKRASLRKGVIDQYRVDFGPAQLDLDMLEDGPWELLTLLEGTQLMRRCILRQAGRTVREDQ